MKFKIHVERKDGTLIVEDTFVVEGDTVADIQAKVNDWMRERGLMDAYAWSEQL